MRPPARNVAAVAALIVAVLAIGVVVQRPWETSERDREVAPITDLGVFEPVRGHIVYRVGSHLEAIDPLHPNVPRIIEPGGLGLGTEAIPAGFSADGSKLGLSAAGDRYVLERTGALSQIPLEESNGAGGCCMFADPPWMSPDGTQTLVTTAPRLGPAGPGSLNVVNLGDGSRSRVVDLQPFGTDMGQPHDLAAPVWSPDGTHAAFVWRQDGGPFPEVAVGIVDLSTGATRELAGSWGLIRYLVYSPDGSQLLVAANRDAPDFKFPSGLKGPHPGSLYLVDIDDGESTEIAAGHFVAAAWSPDGSQIAAIDYPAERNVVLMNADGTGRRILVQLNDAAPSGRKSYVFTGVVWHPIPAR